MNVKNYFGKYINFSLISNCVVFNTLAGCNKKKGGKGCCSYGQRKDNNDITEDDDDKENDDDKKKREEKDKKKEEEDKGKEEEDKAKEEHLKQKKAELENRKEDIKGLLKEVIDSNNELPVKDRIEIKTKEKDIDDCDDIESLNNIFKELTDIKTQILNKANEVGNEELAKQILLNKKNDVIEKFKEISSLILKLKLKISNEFTITITEDEIKKKEKFEELNKIESDLEKQKQELTKLSEKLTTDTPICEDQNEFINKFNERKKELISKNYFKNNDLNNNLEANNLTEDKISDYYSMYQDMTKDVFSHEIALDLQIYRYILKLEGFIDALDNIIKKNRIRYDFFTDYAYDCFDSAIYHKDNGYYLDYEYLVDKKEYTKKDIYSGIFYIDNIPLKYVRCEKGKCNYNENKKYCISCKLRNLLEKENIGDLYKKIYEEYGGSSEAGGTVRSFIFSNIKSKYINRYSFFTYINIDTKSDNNKDYIIYDYENGEEKYKKIKKVLMLEWALTIEFMKRFIPKFTGKNKFYLYRTMGFDNFNPYKPVNELLSQAVDSTSLFGPCYFGMSAKKTICFHKIEAKIYCCFFNHIINPFSNEEKYGHGVKEKFLNCKLKGDYECEIGYIPINQKYEEEVKYDASKDEIVNLQNYVYEKSVENFKQNMLNDPTTKTAKLHVFKDNKIININ